MPSEFGPEDEAGTLRVSAAPVLDFQFGLFLLAKHCLDAGKWVPSWVVELTETKRDLADSLMAFWPDRGLGEVEGAPYREWGDLLVAGWQTGTLFAPRVETYLDAVEPALTKGFHVPELPSEPPAVRELIARRIDWLAKHPEDLALLMRLAREFWEVFQPYWEKFGQDGAERAARELAGRARANVELRELVPGNNYLHKEAFRAHIQAATARGELVIVPLGLAGGGQFYWAFPGLVLIGAGVDSAEREAKRRERAEQAANKLKVLSDPTRVAILCELLKTSSHHPATVTELASQFGLSQPTVSVHVKMLREAGLVRPQREGNQVLYHADEESVRAYLGGALEDILQRLEGPPPMPARTPAREPVLA